MGGGAGTHKWVYHVLGWMGRSTRNSGKQALVRDMDFGVTVEDHRW